MSKKIGKKSDRKLKSFAIFLGVVWAIIVGLFTFSIGRIWNYEEAYYPVTKYFYTSLAQHDFGSFYDRYSSLLYSHIDESVATEYKEIKALGRYEQAAIMYGVYKEHGMEEKAEYHRQDMDKARKDLGALAYATEEIDAICGIE